MANGEELKSNLKGINEETGTLYDRLRGITSEMKGQETSITKSRKAYNLFEKAAQDFKLQSEEISKLDDKKIKDYAKILTTQRAIISQEADRILSNTTISSKIADIQEEIKKENISLKDGNDYLLSEINLLQGISDEEKAILSSRYDQFNVIDKITDTSLNELEVRNKVNKSMGLMGSIIGQISKTFPELSKGFKLDSVLVEMKEFADEGRSMLVMELLVYKH
jgi:hypothetical protein